MNTSSQTSFRIRPMTNNVSNFLGCRLAVDNFRATVKYVGEVNGTTGTWLGIEWDDPERGKHNGIYDGKEYFTCSFPKSGSFIRLSKKINWGQSLTSAVIQKYISTDDDKNSSHPPVKVAEHILVENVGFEKVSFKLKQVHLLEDVYLSASNISVLKEEDSITQSLKSIKSLDLSWNLINDWNDIGWLVGRLTTLRTLQLNGNRFKTILGDISFQGAFSNLNILSLNKTFLDTSSLKTLLKSMPQLESLHLGHNNIESPDILAPGIQYSLKELNLEGNKISRWEDVAILENLKSLCVLHLQDNMLENIYWKEGLFESLQFLNIRNNRISHWDSLNVLWRFPNLTELKMKDNPVVEGIEYDKLVIHMSGRMLNLNKFNGSTISKKQRRNYELYYLNMCAEDKLNLSLNDFASLHPHYEDLVKVHGEPIVNRKPQPTTLKDRLIEITLMCDKSDKKFTKRVLGTMKVRTMKNMVHRLFGVSLKDQSLIIQYPNGLEVELQDDLKEIQHYDVKDGSILLVK